METAGKSATFFLTLTGDELMAGKDNRRSFVAYVSHLENRIQIVGGVSVSTPTAKTTVEGIPIFEAIAPLEEATALGMGTGSRVSLVPYWDDRIPHMIVEIVGVFERIDHSDPSWALTDRVLMASTGEGFGNSIKSRLKSRPKKRNTSCDYNSNSSRYKTIFNCSCTVLRLQKTFPMFPQHKFSSCSINNK